LPDGIGAVTLHFAYGSNMSRALMGMRCPGATALGTATLVGWRFVVIREGFGSIAPQPGRVVHGVLWRLALRDLAAVNAYECLDSGLYVRRSLPVRCAGGQASALVYIGRRSGEGAPRPGYVGVVVDAARTGPPDAYIRSLQRQSPPPGGAHDAGQ
jgi:hypothetical protein